MSDQILQGKTAIITGANSGIGFEAAKDFARKGARVMMAVRNIEKGNGAREQILQEVPQAMIEVLKIDMADLASIRDFANTVKNHLDSLDLLINNAGVMMPAYAKTRDGFELQFGSNHLGHFALTGQLLPLLKHTADSRVVTVSSLAHKGSKILFNNLDGSMGYKKFQFYGQSKLANLMFARELDKRLKAAGLETKSLACHPGISATNLFKFGKQDAPHFLIGLAGKFLQPADMGALPTIYAATHQTLKGGEYIGPNGKGRRRGYPALDTPHPVANDETVITRLWDVSEKLTGVTYDFS
ncbi:oxidoreductase [Bacillus tuaregi]|uniref:oxidoreductase n=1 Tax=Bacillus tuaregi TaxID=1816695 RepID=UPI001113B288|nr:oxidoreductase [Bacillus tuaregi]